MDFIKSELLRRGVPDALVNNRGIRVKTPEQMNKRRQELKKLLMDEEYGVLPKKPDHLKINHLPGIRNFCAGKVRSETFELLMSFGEKEFSFPVRGAIPVKEGKIPAFVHISFTSDTPNIYQPTEEITDRGFAVFSFNCEDIALDTDDFKANCAKHLLTSRRAKNSTGKIMMWAWAAMRVMDCMEAIPEIDRENVAVIGHSVLGKAALVAGAFDERFKYVISNSSGCSGAAIARGSLGESIEKITYAHPHWFCPKYYENTVLKNKPFDQNFLTALIPPRHLLVGSAEKDLWSSPDGEFLGCASADSVYEIYGLRGLMHNGEIPSAGSVLSAGDSSYHIRHGARYLSREDWNIYMDFMENKIKEGSEA